MVSAFVNVKGHHHFVGVMDVDAKTLKVLHPLLTVLPPKPRCNPLAYHHSYSRRQIMKDWELFSDVTVVKSWRLVLDAHMLPSGVHNSWHAIEGM